MKGKFSETFAGDQLLLSWDDKLITAQ